MPDSSLEDYLDSWSGRLRASFLEFAILYYGAYSPEKVYPYSIYKLLNELLSKSLDNTVIPLPTIYSAIKRLEKQQFIRISQDIVGGRVQKIIYTESSGFEVIDLMRENFKDLEQALQFFPITTEVDQTE